MPKKIVLTGAPSTGKSTVINLLKQSGFMCMEEISREIIIEAQEKGIKNIFESNPILFSKSILEKRIDQYKQADNTNHKFCFFDRGLPDITAYLKNSKTSYDIGFDKAVQNFTYDIAFVFPPWEEIYTKDHQRFETFKQAQKVDLALLKEYKISTPKIIIVPKTTPKKRLDFILKHCND